MFTDAPAKSGLRVLDEEILPCSEILINLGTIGLNQSIHDLRMLQNKFPGVLFKSLLYLNNNWDRTRFQSLINNKEASLISLMLATFDYKSLQWLFEMRPIIFLFESDCIDIWSEFLNNIEALALWQLTDEVEHNVIEVRNLLRQHSWINADKLLELYKNRSFYKRGIQPSTDQKESYNASDSHEISLEQIEIFTLRRIRLIESIFSLSRSIQTTLSEPDSKFQVQRPKGISGFFNPKIKEPRELSLIDRSRKNSWAAITVP